MTRGAPTEPPPFHLTDVDRQVLSQTDEEFIPHDWDNLRDIIARNDLGALKRKPSDLRRYMAWTSAIKAEYGSITNYICLRRLGWTFPEEEEDVDGDNDELEQEQKQKLSQPESQPQPQPQPQAQSKMQSVSLKQTLNGTQKPLPTREAITRRSHAYTNPIPFADPSDYKILRNDWPYGLAPGIQHLVIWLRTPVPVKEDGGDMTDEARKLIEDFIHRTFIERLQKEKEMGRFAGDPTQHVLCFKNWTALQSVRALEHVHVLVRDVPERIIYEWTGEGPPELP